MAGLCEVPQCSSSPRLSVQNKCYSLILSVAQKFLKGSPEWFQLGLFGGTAIRQCLELEEQSAAGARDISLS